jgi:hypothetical protein
VKELRMLRKFWDRNVLWILIVFLFGLPTLLAGVIAFIVAFSMIGLSATTSSVIAVVVAGITFVIIMKTR